MSDGNKSCLNTYELQLPSGIKGFIREIRHKELLLKLFPCSKYVGNDSVNPRTKPGTGTIISHNLHCQCLRRSANENIYMDFCILLVYENRDYVTTEAFR